MYWNYDIHLFTDSFIHPVILGLSNSSTSSINNQRSSFSDFLLLFFHNLPLKYSLFHKTKTQIIILYHLQSLFNHALDIPDVVLKIYQCLISCNFRFPRIYHKYRSIKLLKPFSTFYSSFDASNLLFYSRFFEYNNFTLSFLYIG